MKVKIYGFSVDSSKLPGAVTAPEFFSSVTTLPWLEVGQNFKLGIANVSVPTAHGAETWMAGMSIKVRDAKAFNKLINDNGQLTLTSENLEENAKLAEVNFFLIHPQTGNGLYCYYSSSASLMMFSLLMKRAFKEYLRTKRDAQVKAAPVKDRKAMRAKFKGDLEIGQLCQTKDLKALVTALTSVKSCDFKFNTVISRKTLFRGIYERSESEVVKFVMMEDVDTADLAEAIDRASSNAQVEEVTVRGVDSGGVNQTYHIEENALQFGDFDYDDYMGNLNLDLSNWASSIISSSVIAKLVGIASGGRVHGLLSKVV
jgi:hypothetical protein